MELNNKVKELEDELKILKAEIHNVLLDIREVILDKSNPLSEEHESAFIRMDLNTTARAMAAEAAGREVGRAVEEAAKVEEEKRGEEKPKEEEKPEDQGTSATAGKGKGSRKGKGSKDAPKTEPADAPLEPAEIPPMFRASAAAPASALGLATWVVDTMKALGPHQLDRVIAIHRLCGNLPPNVSEALSHLQELIRTSEGEEPPWLRALQDLDKVASS